MSSADKPSHFLQNILAEDIAKGRVDSIVTRFPPEPNGYLHIGHAKSICLNFGLAREFGGICHLRFDDTNPLKEDQEYVDAIMKDVRWLGFEWSDEVRFTSDYFEQLFDWALHLIKSGKAYVCELSADEAREHRGTLTEPGRNSPWRDRPVKQSLERFAAMRAGEMAEGSATLRARIDMAHGNINMRDPVLYRIRHAHHHRTGDAWKIYPSYDYAHGQGDAIEGVTHSICTLEFQDHRPLYEWFIENLPVPSRPHQYEFARLNLNYTVTSKRKLKMLVDSGIVDGWDDPRMPTIAGMRRRGYSAAALRSFCDLIGVTKADSVVDVGMLEYAVRDDLDKNAPRAMCVLQPLKVVLTNFADNLALEAGNHPQRPELGTRAVSFSGEIWIDAEDFREEANKHFKRLVLGKRVRLRHAFVIEADEAIKNDSGEVIEVRARIIEGTLGENPADGISPKGVIQWVDAATAVPCRVMNYDDRLFLDANPGSGGTDFLDQLNPDSLQTIDTALVEAGLADAPAGSIFQFERIGYFCRDNRAGGLVFNRTIGLRDGQGKTSS